MAVPRQRRAHIEEGDTVRPLRITGNVFVANLPPGFTDARLAELFDPYGLVLSAYLARDPDSGATRNHGLVDLAPASVLPQAIEALDGSAIDGQRISVRSADPDLALRPPRPQGGGTRAARPAARPRPPAAPPAPRPAVIVERRPLGRRLRSVE
jgi:RNA recognition motif-containing protein